MERSSSGYRRINLSVIFRVRLNDFLEYSICAKDFGAALATYRGFSPTDDLATATEGNQAHFAGVLLVNSAVPEL